MKINEILDRFEDYCDHNERHIPVDDCSKEIDRGVALSEIKKAMEEVIGEDYEFTRPKDDYLPEVYKYLKAKNELRKEQCKRLEKLFE